MNTDNQKSTVGAENPLGRYSSKIHFQDELDLCSAPTAQEIYDKIKRETKPETQYQATKMTEPSKRTPVPPLEAIERYKALYCEFYDDFTKTFLWKPSDGTYLFFGDKDIPSINEFWTKYNLFLAAQHALPVITANLIEDDSMDQKVIKTQWFYFHGLPTYIKSSNIIHRSIDGKAIVPVGIKWVSTAEVAASPPSSLDPRQ